MEKQIRKAAEREICLQLCAEEGIVWTDTSTPFGQFGCIIMASGLGKRFGSNKLMADFHGAPLFTRALRSTDGIFSRRVVVTRHPEVAEYCRIVGVDVVLHDEPFRSDTVRLGLEAIGEGIRGCLFCPGDQPLLRWESVAKLALHARNEPEMIWRTTYKGVPGSPVLFPQWAFAELMALPAGKGGGFLVKKYPDRVRLVSVAHAEELCDADTPEALRALAAYPQPW